MNRANTLKELSNQNRGWPVVVPSQRGDYVLGVTKQKVKRGYYTKLYSDVEDEMVVKAGDDMRANVSVTLHGFADDSCEEMYGRLYGYTVGPWNMYLTSMRLGRDSKEFEEFREKHTWRPKEDECI